MPDQSVYLTIKNSLLVNRAFISSLGKIAACGLAIKRLVLIKRLWNMIQTAEQQFQEARIALAKKWAEKDENGEAKHANNEFIFSDENKKEFEKEYQELMNMDVEIKASKLVLSGSDFLPTDRLTLADIVNVEEVITIE